MSNDTWYFIDTQYINAKSAFTVWDNVYICHEMLKCSGRLCSDTGDDTWYLIDTQDINAKSVFTVWCHAYLCDAICSEGLCIDTCIALSKVLGQPYFVVQPSQHIDKAMRLFRIPPMAVRMQQIHIMTYQTQQMWCNVQWYLILDWYAIHKC